MQVHGPGPSTSGVTPVRGRRITLALAGLTLLVLLLSVPGSLREAFDRGGFYLFSHAFQEDLPKRLTGPGRFRFVLQPLIATILGIRSALPTREQDGRRTSWASRPIASAATSSPGTASGRSSISCSWEFCSIPSSSG
jgi:hypothetical protein